MSIVLRFYKSQKICFFFSFVFPFFLHHFLVYRQYAEEKRWETGQIFSFFLVKAAVVFLCCCFLLFLLRYYFCFCSLSFFFFFWRAKPHATEHTHNNKKKRKERGDKQKVRLRRGEVEMNPTLRHKKNLERRNRAEKTLAKTCVPACFFFFFRFVW